MKQTIQKTLITNINQLKKDDVVYIFEKRQFKRNKESEHQLDNCNFHRITVVSNIRQLNDKTWVWDNKHHGTLHSTNGDHKIVNSLLDNGTIASAGTFGFNHRINEHADVYKLDNITNNYPSFKPINLVGNPGYDLMM